MAKEMSIYLGGFMLTSCQQLSDMQTDLLHTTSDQHGRFEFANLNEGYLYTIVTKAPSYKHGCTVVDLSSNARQHFQLSYRVPLTRQIPAHSMRLIMHWVGPVDYDLYGMFADQQHECITGPISKPCGGMSFNQAEKNIKYLSIDTIQPFPYLFYVTRFLQHEKADLKILKDSQVHVNQEMLSSRLKVIVYVPELAYPLIEYPMPICKCRTTLSLSVKKDDYNQIDFTWLLFCIDGTRGDGPRTLQKYWHDFSSQDVLDQAAYKQPTWPTLKECQQK